MTKQQIKRLIAEPKIDIPNAEATFLLIDLAFVSYASHSHKVSGIKPDYIASYVDPSRKPNFHQLISQKTIEEIGYKLYDNYLRDPKTLDKKIEGHKKSSELSKKLWQQYRAGKNKKSDFKKFLKNLYPWWSYAIIGEDRGRIIETKIIPAFARRHSLDLNRAREIVNVMIHPGENSVLNVERIDFLNLCLAVAGGRQYKKLINKYLKNNYWFKSNFAEAEDITPNGLLSDVASMIKDKSQAEIRQELNSIYGNLRKIKNDQKKIRQKIKLLPQDKKDFVFAQKVVQWIDWRKAWMMQSCYFTFMMVKDAIKSLGLTYKEISFYTDEELFSLIAEGKHVDKKIIKFRQSNKSFSFYLFGQKKKIFFGSEAEELFAIASRNDGKEIKGVIASTGGKKIVRGTARIVLDPSKDEFKKGEILITSMTRIEFVPLMRHALAIITDEGGLGCHAAIVSRELRLPCIIGTKNGTKLLKNGDKVEMDMGSGKVKIL